MQSLVHLEELWLLSLSLEIHLFNRYSEYLQYNMKKKEGSYTRGYKANCFSGSNVVAHFLFIFVLGGG